MTAAAGDRLADLATGGLVSVIASAPQTDGFKYVGSLTAVDGVAAAVSAASGEGVVLGAGHLSGFVALSTN